MQQVSIEKAMQLAIELGKEAFEIGNGPFGAVVLQGQVVVGASRNTTTDEFDPTAHAEVKAIRNACAKLKQVRVEDCVLVTSCYPCSMCLSAAYWAGISTIYYAIENEDTVPMGYDDSRIYKELKLSDDDKSIRFFQLMHSEGMGIIKQE